MPIANEMLKFLTAETKSSSRSKQTAIGPSEIGGCRRKVWLKLNGAKGTNETLKLAAIMGTAIHSKIEEAFKRQDPFGERFLLEIEVESDGLMGHVDLYDKENCEVVDWKTTKTKNLGTFPSKQQRWQVQLYGWLLSQNGYEVNTVTLVAIARDGDERDVIYHSEPYDPAIATEARDWLSDVARHEEAPAPEKDAFFCKLYCGYFGELCGGRPKAEADGAPLNDNDAVSAASQYLKVVEQIQELELIKDGLKVALEGHSGVTPEGILVKWTEVAGRKTVDETEVKKLLGFVPTKTGKESMRLQVKK